MQLLLASASPRRRELLASVGLHPRVLVADVDESFLPGESALEAAKRLALKKAQAVSEREPEMVVLAADTIVSFEDTLLAKPATAEEALEMLSLLNGRTHLVTTGCALCCVATSVERVFQVTTAVSFRAASDTELSAYARCGEPLDKAGAYGIQGKGAFLVSRIDGSYTNVVGLPLAELLQELMALRLWGPELL